jgi:putative PIN family toxin of toxin-antitoxin system
MPSYVLDTAVLVAALRSSAGASRQLLLFALDRRFDLLLSIPLLLEYEAVLTRPEHLTESRLTKMEVAKVLDDLASVAKQVDLAFRWRPQAADPNDDMVIEAAINGNADVVVTFNKRDIVDGLRHFRCEVLTPGIAVRKIRSAFNEKK